MKVYALWHEENGYEYRWRTILQFGTSWNVIGSVYMKNPGSAYPIAVPDNDTLKLLNKKFSNSDEWKKFNWDKDLTIKYIKSLFHEYYKTESLNGVIQIFNLFNLRDAGLVAALKVLKTGSCNENYVHSFDEDLNNLVFPVYLGWGNLLNDSYFKEAPYAEKIEVAFNTAKELTKKQNKKWYLDDDLHSSNNHYYHPKFIYLHPHSEDDKVEAEKRSFLSMF